MGSLARIFAIVLLCAGLLSCAQGSDDTVEGFFHEIEQGELAAAVARFSPRVHEKFGDDELARAVMHWSQEIKAHGGLDDVSLNGAVVTFNQLALYDVTLTFHDGMTKSLQTSVIRVNGRWYINSAL